MAGRLLGATRFLLVVSHYFYSKITKDNPKENHDNAYDPPAGIANATGDSYQKADYKQR
jgi:hypothetical protein